MLAIEDEKFPPPTRVTAVIHDATWKLMQEQQKQLVIPQHAWDAAVDAWTRDGLAAAAFQINGSSAASGLPHAVLSWLLVTAVV